MKYVILFNTRAAPKKKEDFFILFFFASLISLPLPFFDRMPNVNVLYNVKGFSVFEWIIKVKTKIKERKMEFCWMKKKKKIGWIEQKKVVEIGKNEAFYGKMIFYGGTHKMKNAQNSALPNTLILLVALITFVVSPNRYRDRMNRMN